MPEVGLGIGCSQADPCCLRVLSSRVPAPAVNPQRWTSPRLSSSRSD